MAEGEEVEVMLEVGAEDTLATPKYTPKAKKRAAELAEKKKKGKEPEQHSSDDEPPNESGGRGCVSK